MLPISCTWTASGEINVGSICELTPLVGPVPNSGTSGILAGIICCGEGLPMPPELALDATSLLGGGVGIVALGIKLLTLGGVLDCNVAGIAGGGGIVPTTGEDIIGGTMGITFGVGGWLVVGLAPIAVGLVIF